MKYFGQTFNKFMSSDRNEIREQYMQIEDALLSANKQWDIENGKALSKRLLVVCEINEEKVLIRTAFFEFQNANECQEFASKKNNEIKWTDEANKIWNGNPRSMKN